MNTTTVDRTEPLSELRQKIDRVDHDLVTALAERFRLAEEVGTLKRKTGTLPLDPRREAEIVRRVCDGARGEGRPADGVRAVGGAGFAACREGVIRRHASRDEPTGAPSGSAGTPLG